MRPSTSIGRPNYVHDDDDDDDDDGCVGTSDYVSLACGSLRRVSTLSAELDIWHWAARRCVPV